MICPKCKYEYKPEITKCPDCDEYLVAQIIEKAAAEVPDESWTPVCKLISDMKSDIAKGALDSNNIPSMVISSTFGAYGKGLGFTSGLTTSGSESNLLMVPREFKPEAVLVLQAVLGDDYKELEI